MLHYTPPLRLCIPQPLESSPRVAILSLVTCAIRCGGVAFAAIPSNSDEVLHVRLLVLAEFVRDELAMFTVAYDEDGSGVQAMVDDLLTVAIAELFCS